MLYLYCLHMSKNPSVLRYSQDIHEQRHLQEQGGKFCRGKGAPRRGEVQGAGRSAADSDGGSDDDPMRTKSRLDLALAALELMTSGRRAEDRRRGSRGSVSR